MYCDATDDSVVILDLTGVDADPHRHPEFPHDIANRASAADGGGGTVKDGEALIPNGITEAMAREQAEFMGALANLGPITS